MVHIRSHFPFLAAKNPFVYLDNAASTQFPSSVLAAMDEFSKNSYAPVHRSMYARAESATEQFEAVRNKTAKWLNTQPEEIVFTKGTTESINAIAWSWGRHNLQPGDEILMPESEHHASLLAWNEIAHTVGAQVRYIPIKPDTILNGTIVQNYITNRTKILCISHVSHIFGTEHDISSIISIAHTHGVRVFIDAAQSVVHKKLDLAALQPDFLAFSCHKMFGPTGLGILYINKKVQPETPPYQFGGGMVYHANFTNSSWHKAPLRYQAGTPPIVQVIGFGATLDFLEKQVNFETLKQHEAALCKQLIEYLQTISGAVIYGNIQQLQVQGHMVSFSLPVYHHHDIGSYLDSAGIAARTGHLCAQPMVQKLGIPGLIRVSFAAYNTTQDVKNLTIALTQLLSL